jgi:tRNA(Arg) A34 adenosine deaminase TadA
LQCIRQGRTILIMEDTDTSYMQLALGAAKASKASGDVPFGAVIKYQNKVLVAVSNSEHVDQDVTKHAELKAISEASHALGTRDLSECTIYSTVEPCPMCAGAIFHACVKRVVFGMSRDDLTHLFRTRHIRLWDLAKDWHYKPEIVGGVLKDEVIKAFLEYKEPFRVVSKAEPLPAAPTKPD